MSPLMNAWALLYEDFFMTEHSEHYYDFDRNGRITNADNKDWNDFWDSVNGVNEFRLSGVMGASSEDVINFKTMKNSHTDWKYNEEVLLQELKEYILGTYNQHYSAGDDKVQTLDLIEACGDGEAFCRSNILKYASRYDKKGTARRDILKIMHYAVLLMYFNDKTSHRETYPQ